MSLSTPSKLLSKTQAIINALQATRDPEIESFLCALLVDETSAASDRRHSPLESLSNKPPYSLRREVATLVTLHEAYAGTVVEQTIAEVISALVIRVYQQAVGLERARLLETIWLTTPYSIKAYGHLRSCYLDATLDDILQEYPDKQIPEDDLNAWIFLAQVALRSGDAKGAANILSAIKHRSPSNPFLDELLANALIGSDDTETADALYRSIEDHLFVWPAGLVRLSDSFFNDLTQNPEWDTDNEQISWIIPVAAAETIFVVGLDDNYAKRYLGELLESLTRKNSAGGWLLHIHMVNATEETLRWIKQLHENGAALALTAEKVTPRISETSSTQRIIETRTYFACARLRVLPALLDCYEKPLWVIDADMQALRPVDTLLAEAGIAKESDLGIVLLGPRARCVSEYIWLSLCYYTPSPACRYFARTLSRYINYHFAHDHWGWGLDQVASFCVLTWFMRHKQELRISTIPASFIADRHSSTSISYFQSLVGSIS